MTTITTITTTNEIDSITDALDKKLAITISDSDTTIEVSKLQLCKQKGLEWIEKMLAKEQTTTKPGSISYLLFGAKPSEQSINIKMGRFGEYLVKELIQTNKDLELLQCGVQSVNDKKKDIDLIFKNEMTKTVYYYELKGNIELDTEKIPATIAKCKEIETYIQGHYPDYKIHIGVLNWSVYNRTILTSGISNIARFEASGVKINHMSDFLAVIGVEWIESDFYEYFRDLGKIIKK